MSGSTIGGIVGGTIGFFVGSPQLGWMIGSAIGGYLDPDQIEGPRLKDAQVQTSQEGVPRPIVYGTAQVAGNLIQRGPLVERRRKERAGKGGPEQITYHYYMTYAIRVCEGPIAGIRRIWRDDKLVYSLRPGDTIDADSAAFASKLTIYLGNETQLPDPSLEALPAANGGGAGNVPSYRGSAYVVFENDDLTERRGTVPQYRFEVVSAGVTEETCTDHPDLIAWWPLDDAAQNGAAREVIGGWNGAYTNTVGVGSGPAMVAGGGSSFYMETVYDGMHADLQVTDAPRTDWLDEWTVTCWCRPTDIAAGSVLKNAAAYWTDTILGHHAWLLSLSGTDNMQPSGTVTNAGNSVGVNSSAVAAGKTLFLGMKWVADSPGSLAGTLTFYENGLVVGSTNANRVSGLREYIAVGGGAIFPDSYGFIGYVQHVKIYGAALSDAQMADRYRNADEYLQIPDSPTSYVDHDGNVYSSSCVARITPSTITVADIVGDLCGRVGIPAAKLDTTELTDSVGGFSVARQMPSSEAIRSLQRGYRFDMPEWDKKLRGIKRGGAIKDTITDADLVGDEEETRAQALEYPRKFNLIVSDPEANYEAVTITSARSPGWVASDNQTTVELPIIFTDVSEREQVCDILHKVAWTEMAGRLKIELPEEWTWLTPSDCFDFNYKRWRAEKVEVLDGSMKVDAVRDRASAYTSNANGVARNPTGPVSSIRGPTILQALNLPRLSSAHNVPGMYVAVTGVLPAWDGATLTMSTDAGVTFTSVLQMISRATMGELVAGIAASGEPITVDVYDNRELDTITAAQMADRQNGFAITTAGVSEVGQFQTATETTNWALTDVSRGQLGTSAVTHAKGDSFLLLDDAVYFLPLDSTLIGREIIFRAVTNGTAPENNASITVIFDPLFTGPEVIAFLLTEANERLLVEDGSYLLE